MTHGMSSLRSNAKKPQDNTNSGKSSGVVVLSANVKGVQSPPVGSPTSPEATSSRSYVHSPYSSAVTMLSDADALRSFEEQQKQLPPQLSSPKTPGRQPNLNTKDGRRQSGSGRQGAVSSPLMCAVDGSAVKKNVCRHYLEGTCNRGSACRFYHPGASHRVVPAPRTPTRRPLTPLADLLAQEQSDLAQSSAYASPTVLPPSAFAEAQRATPPNSDSGNNSFTLNPLLTQQNSFAAPVLSPPAKPAHRSPAPGFVQLVLPRSLASANASVDNGDLASGSPLISGAPGSQGGGSVTKNPVSSAYMTFARAPASPTKRQNNPYAYAQ